MPRTVPPPRQRPPSTSAPMSHVSTSIGCGPRPVWSEDHSRGSFSTRASSRAMSCALSTSIQTSTLAFGISTWVAWSDSIEAFAIVRAS